LGLDFDPNALHISFNEAHALFLDEVSLRHLLVGNGSAHLAVRRSSRHAVVDVIDRRGDIRVLTTA
jgi:hypothetical protein